MTPNLPHNLDKNFETQLTQSMPTSRPEFEAELWTRLQSQLANPSPQTSRSKTRAYSFQRVATLIAILVGVVVGGTFAVQALLQWMGYLDPGLQAVVDEGLRRDLNITQTGENFSVTLDWGYADANRIAIHYTVRLLGDTRATTLQTGDALTATSSNQQVQLVQGRNMIADYSEEYPEGITRESLGAAWYRFGTITEVLNQYDASALSLQDATELPLQLDIWVVAYSIHEFFVTEEGDDAPSDGFIVGEQFSIPFSIPLDAINTQLRVWESPLSVTDQDITLTLERVTVAPSQARVYLCFTPPAEDRSWTAIVWLRDENGAVPGGGSVNPSMVEGRSCQDYTYYAGMYDYTGTWQLEVTELVGFGSGGGADQQRIAGSWVFDFTVP